MDISMNQITKQFGSFTALEQVSLKVHDGEMIAILGSSGCGKTTLLRIVAGLIPLTSGEVFLGEENITDWPAQKRNTAMVFQNYALFPHMTLEENISYGLKIRKFSKHEIDLRLKEVLKQVRLEGLEKRKIQELSGGQKQRAALARALVTEPDVLLFDEPLSNLDEKLRVMLRTEIKRIQSETKITSLYVTHDQKEAMSIADRIVIMNEGKLIQIGTPIEIFRRPTSRFTAEFMGHKNVFEVKTKNGLVQFLNETKDVRNDTSSVTLVLFPEDINISRNRTEYQTIGSVNSFEILGNIIEYCVHAGAYTLYVDQFVRQTDQIIPIGTEVSISFSADALYLIDENRRKEESR